MKRRLEKYWWIELPCFFCAMVLVEVLLRAADLEDAVPGHGSSFAQFAVWACCVFAVDRLLRFALWAVVVMIRPKRAADLP